MFIKLSLFRTEITESWRYTYIEFVIKYSKLIRMTMEYRSDTYTRSDRRFSNRKRAFQIKVSREERASFIAYLYDTQTAARSFAKFQMKTSWHFAFVSCEMCVCKFVIRQFVFFEISADMLIFKVIFASERVEICNKMHGNILTMSVMTHFLYLYHQMVEKS